MLVPILNSILPKTLLKWTTPQSKLATKFKTKNTATTATTTVKTTFTLLCPAAFITTTTTTKIPTITIFKHINSASLSSSSSSSSLSFKSFYISILIVAKLFLHTVINNLSSLMNDFRTKLRYLTTSTSNATLFSNLASLSTSSSTATTTIDTKLFNTNYKNNHRTYNNSSKSNKVFLYYTPRDPRLRIFNQQLQQQQQGSLATTLNKHLVSLESDSESKITEDLCNYGELIGGFTGVINKNFINSELLNNKNNNYNKIVFNCCDLKKISADKSVDNTHVNSEKSNKTSQKNCQELQQKYNEHVQQQIEKVFQEQLLNKSSVHGHRMNHYSSIAINGLLTAVIRF